MMDAACRVTGDGPTLDKSNLVEAIDVKRRVDDGSINIIHPGHHCIEKDFLTFCASPL